MLTYSAPNANSSQVQNHGVAEIYNPDAIADNISRLITLIPLAHSPPPNETNAPNATNAANASNAPNATNGTNETYAPNATNGANASNVTQPLEYVFADPLRDPASLRHPIPQTLTASYASPPPLLARSEAHFAGGSLSQGIDYWRDTLLPASSLSPRKSSRIVQWLTYGVHIPDFFVPFRGKFAGRHYDSPTPLRYNASNRPMPLATHQDYVTNEIARLLSVNDAQASHERPHIVCPLGVAEQKGKLRFDRFSDFGCLSRFILYVWNFVRLRGVIDLDLDVRIIW